MTARTAPDGLFNNPSKPPRRLRHGRRRPDHHLSRTRIARKPCLAEAALRELHRRPLGRPGRGRLQRQSESRHGHSRSARSRARPRTTSSSRSTPRTRRARRGARPRRPSRARGPERDRRRDRGEPRDARGRRELGERQAGPRDAQRRPAAGDRPLPLLRRRDPRRGGPDLRDRQGHDRLPLPRAARRRRADHPVQLPAADGGVEAGARRSPPATAW